MKRVPRPGRKQRRGPNHYGARHQQDRKDWAAQVETGTVLCSVCGYLIRRGTPWHLDHLVPISLGGDPMGPKHPAHAACNISKGGANRIRRKYSRRFFCR